jgi:hypothetical protein
MKILIIQENGRHDANRKYRECFSLQRAFIFYGHECDVWGLGHLNYTNIPNFESYDWIINLENYDESNWVPNLSNIKNPKKFLWSIDAHCRGRELKELHKTQLNNFVEHQDTVNGEKLYEEIFDKGQYDYLLHSTKDFVKKPHHIWFPNGFDDTLVQKIDIPKKYDIGFCGSYVNRKSILEWLQNSFNVHLDIFVIGDEMVKVLNSYKCHFNLNIANDINYRSFETIGCGTLLLTNYNNQYDDLGFKDGINCFMYKDEEDLVNKIQFIKQNNISEISKNGYELSKKHSYKERVKILFGL